MEVLIGAGRFDVLWIENFQCPSCGAIYDRFAVQTKALGMHGYGYKKGDKIYFHHDAKLIEVEVLATGTCTKCNHDIDVWVKIKNNIYTGEYEIEGFRYNLSVGDDEDERPAKKDKRKNR